MKDNDQPEKPVCKQQYRWAGVVHFIPATLLVGLGMLPLLIYLLGLVGPNSSFPSAVRALPGFLKPLVFTTPNYLFERTLELQFKDQTSLALDQAKLLQHAYAFPHRMAGVFTWHFLKFAHLWDASLVKLTLASLLCPSTANMLKLLPEQEVAQITLLIRDPLRAGSSHRYQVTCNK